MLFMVRVVESAYSGNVPCMNCNVNEFAYSFLCLFSRLKDGHEFYNQFLVKGTSVCVASSCDG